MSSCIVEYSIHKDALLFMTVLRIVVISFFFFSSLFFAKKTILIPHCIQHLRLIQTILTNPTSSRTSGENVCLRCPTRVPFKTVTEVDIQKSINRSKNTEQKEQTAAPWLESSPVALADMQNKRHLSRSTKPGRTPAPELPVLLKPRDKTPHRKSSHTKKRKRQ